MNKIRNLIMKNRYTLLLTTILAYILAVVVGGAVTGRDARVIDLENPFFDLDVRDFDEFREARSDDDDEADFDDR